MDVVNFLGDNSATVPSYLAAHAGHISRHLIRAIPAGTMQSIGSSEVGVIDTLAKVISVFDAYEYFSRKWEGLSTEKAFSKGAEVFQVVVDLTGKGASFVEGLGGLKLVAAKVTAVAATAGLFIGIGASALQLGVDSWRAYQITRELFQKKIDLETKGRISFKTLTGAKRSDFQGKEKSEDLYDHIRIRLKTQLALRAAAIGAGSVSIAGTLVLAFAPTPVAPLAWALLALGAVIGIGAFIANYFISKRLDKELMKLPPVAQKVEDVAMPLLTKKTL